MKSRFLVACLFALAVHTPAFADDAKPDDVVAFDLSAEDWVVTKTAHVTVNVEAAVSATNAGSMRADMTKAVDDAAKSDWRLTNFNRTQDSTGMEHWSVSFESRLPETALNSLPDAVKKASKAGMQMTVGDIDFTPTLDETEAARAGLRTKLMKSAVDQLASVNGAMTGRTYHIAQISFDGVGVMPHPLMRPKVMMANMAMPASPPVDTQDRAQKMVMVAHVVYAATPPQNTH